MPYKRVEPLPESMMNRTRYLGHHSICEKIREIWRIAKENGDEETQFKCREAAAMAKKMHERLKSYKDYREGEEGQQE